MRLKLSFLGVMALFLSTLAQAQNTPMDTLSANVKKMQSDISVLKRVKFSGYIQAQAQIADSSGIASFAGGNFNANTDNRFMVRRGRLKVTYDNSMSQFVFQIDGTEKGIGIKDAYARFTEPWAKAFHATVGIFNRPFGFEIGYSSSSRETPERGRMSQTIFPGEREVGAMLTFQMPEKSKLHFLKIDAGMFNGSGQTASDFDSQKDFIGRIRADKSLKDKKLKLGLGVSYYNGGWRQGTSKVYSVSADALGLPAFILDRDTTNYGAISKRTYVGGDVQFSMRSKLGTTTLRGEYIAGKQPGILLLPQAHPANQPPIHISGSSMAHISISCRISQKQNINLC